MIQTIEELKSKAKTIKSLAVSGDPLTKIASYIEEKVEEEKDTELLNITFSGVELVFDPFDSEDRLNKVKNIGLLTLIAERVIIKGPLRLPGTEVHIYAHNLVFKDEKPEKPAAIITSPTEFELRAKDASRIDGKEKKGEDGKNGQKAGDIKLIIDKLTINSLEESSFSEVFPKKPQKIRFIMNGASGQDPGLGLEGLNGHSCKVVVKPNITYIIHRFTNEFGNSTGNDLTEGSSNCRPTNGKNAIAGGRPGSGGNGGSFYINKSQAPVHLIQNEGGKPGKFTPAYKGGNPGTPKEWFHKDITTVSFRQQIDMPPMPPRTREQITKQGGPTKGGDSSPQINGKHGKSGGIITEPENKQLWLNIKIIQAKISMLQDAYLGNYLDSARKISSECKNLFKQFDLKNKLKQGIINEYSQIAIYYHQILQYDYQLNNNLDYFGNRLGWTPFLPLTVMYDVYQDQIDQHIRSLSLSYWLEYHWKIRRERQVNLQQSIEIEKDQIRYSKEVYKKAEQILPLLSQEFLDIKQEIKKLNAKLKEKEETIIASFKSDQLKKEAGRAALLAFSGMLTFATFPLLVGGGPAIVGGLGAIFLLDFTESIVTFKLDNDDFLINEVTINQLIEQRGTNTDSFSEIEEARKNLIATNVTDTTDQDNFIKELKDLSKILSEVTQIELREQKELDTGFKELIQAMFENKDFEEIFNNVAELITSKQIFLSKALETVQQIDQSINAIAQSNLAIDQMNKSLREEEINESMQQILREMITRSKERLIKYQYYVAKAYEYRRLRGYPGEYNPTELFNEMRRYSNNDSSPQNVPNSNPSELFKHLQTLYYNELSNIKDSILVEFSESDAGSHTRSYRLILNTSQLEQLNFEGRVELDLHQLVIQPNDLNTRLQDIEVDIHNTLINASGEEDVSLAVTFETVNWSVIRSKNQDYYFTYGNLQDSSVFVGGFIWHNNREENNFIPFEENNNDTAILSGNSDQTKINLGARTKLQITRKNIPETALIEIQALELDIQVSLQASEPKQ